MVINSPNINYSNTITFYLNWTHWTQNDHYMYRIQYYWNKRSRRIGYNGFLFPHEYSIEGRDTSPEYECGKRNPLYPIRAYIFTLLMFRKPNKTTINKNKTTNLYRSMSFRFSFIFRYFKVFQVKRIVYI